jgi:hypothetical protein
LAEIISVAGAMAIEFGYFPYVKGEDFKAVEKMCLHVSDEWSGCFFKAV